MSAPADIAEVILISTTTAGGVAIMALTFLSRWRMDVDRRLEAIEVSSRAPEEERAVPSTVAPGTFEPALLELRGTLSLFDVADAVVRQRSKAGEVGTEGEVRGRTYAAWSLSRAAERLAAAYVRDAEAGVRI